MKKIARMAYDGGIIRESNTALLNHNKCVDKINEIIDNCPYCGASIKCQTDKKQERISVNFEVDEKHRIETNNKIFDALESILKNDQIINNWCICNLNELPETNDNNKPNSEYVHITLKREDVPYFIDIAGEAISERERELKERAGGK